MHTHTHVHSCIHTYIHACTFIHIHTGAHAIYVCVYTGKKVMENAEERMKRIEQIQLRRMKGLLETTIEQLDEADDKNEAYLSKMQALQARIEDSVDRVRTRFRPMCSHSYAAVCLSCTPQRVCHEFSSFVMKMLRQGIAEKMRC